MSTIEPDKSVSDKSLTSLIYLLYALSLVLGVTALVAIVMNYVKRDDVQGTWLESHFRWQIRSFWFAVMWIAVSGLMVLTIIGVPFALVLLLIAGLWILYRVVRGWWNLMQRQTMPMA